MTKWAAPLALTRWLLVGLCVCWPSYATAEGTERDHSQDQTQTAEAVAAIRLAAEQGDASAQDDLGLMYEAVGKKSTRTGMSKAARLAVSRRMKTYWAKRKKKEKT